ncbi:hypothetical protein DXG03_004272 [Asterophora parasitica]|uniref:Uncharacterized protein n=1 Tax=Asterophora parasitica TaxID=117018 RepID=A0A9P7KAB9_9AGAR|nr:hypothetical protein DXG03_004272 [Asterophora parasitica]
MSSRLDPELGSPESFGFLLYQHNTLFHDVKAAKASGNFERIWKLCIELARSPTFPPLAEPERVPEILSSIRSSISALVTGTAEVSPWSFEHIPAELAIQLPDRNLRCTSDFGNTPPMLIYDLGKFQKDPILNKRVKSIFCKGQNTFLNNLPPPNSLGFQFLLERNQEMSNQRFSLVLLVHLFVFREFLKAMQTSDDKPTHDHKRRWFLAQWWHAFLDPGRGTTSMSDAYMKLYDCLEDETLNSINTMLSEVAADVASLLPGAIVAEGLFIAIDEANVGVKLLRKAFHGDTGHHPVLKEVIRIWKERLTVLGVPITFIIAGTEISKQHFPQSSPEWSTWKWTSNTGAFDDQSIQRRYVAAFLPPALTASKTGELLLQHIWNWCRARQMQLDGGASNLHLDELLNAFERLPQGLPTGGQLSILRTIACFPSQPSLPRNVAQRMKSPLVAVLNTESFISGTEAVCAPEIVEGLIASIHGKRRTFADDLSTPIEKQKAQVTEKSKDGTIAPPSSKRVKKAPQGKVQGVDEALGQDVDTTRLPLLFKNTMQHITERLTKIVAQTAAAASGGSGCPLIVPWYPAFDDVTPEIKRHIQSLRIPNLYGNPYILLHGLCEPRGSEDPQKSVQLSRIARVFLRGSVKKHSYVVNRMIQVSALLIRIEEFCSTRQALAKQDSYSKAFALTGAYTSLATTTLRAR